jgi:hypothetical protein
MIYQEASCSSLLEIILIAVLLTPSFSSKCSTRLVSVTMARKNERYGKGSVMAAVILLVSSEKDRLVL